jgi:hypothetical protein
MQIFDDFSAVKGMNLEAKKYDYDIPVSTEGRTNI